MAQRQRIRRVLLSAALAFGAVLSVGTTPATAGTASPSWELLPLPADGYLQDVIPFSATSAFGVTTKMCDPEGVYSCPLWWRLAGQTWSEFALPTGLRADAVTGTSVNDAWFLGRTSGAKGLAYHWNGSTWTDHSPAAPKYTVSAAAAVSPTSIWSAGTDDVSYHTRDDQATVGHWDGTKWTVTKLPKIPGKTTSLQALHALSDNDVWAAGTQCKKRRPVGKDSCQAYVVHWDGRQWSQVAVPELTPHSAWVSTVASRGGQVWVAGMERDSIVSGGPERFFVLHWNGQTWRKDYLPGTDITSRYEYGAVTGLAFHGSELLVGVDHPRNGGVMRWKGPGWEPTPGPLPTPTVVRSLVRAASGDVFAVGTNPKITEYFLARLPAPTR